MAGISVYQLKNSAWTSVLDKPVPLTGLWSDSPSSVHVTAVTSGEGQNYKSAHYQFDGQAWHEYPSVADRMYGGVWGVSSTDQWIFGGVMPAKITPTDFGEPLLRHYDGTNWTEETTATPVKGVVVDAWGTSATQLWALVLGGTILRRQGKMWYEITSPTQKNLWGIWGAGPSDMWAVGDGGTIIHYNGGAWSVVASPTTEDLKAIWGTTADDVWAVGNKGTILHLE
jgi:hypothetical protein